MLCRSVGIITACALGASAFLLPPGTATESADNTNFAISVVKPKKQILELPCASCAFPSKQEQVAEEGDEPVFSIQGGANNLILNFVISEDGQALELNGEAIYPPHFHREGFPEMHSWSVEQVSASTSSEEIQSGDYQATPLRITGSGLRVSQEEALTPNGDMLVPLKWQIFALEDRPMTVDEVAVKLLKLDNGELLIMDVEVVQGEHMDLPFGLAPPAAHGHPQGHSRPYQDCNMPAPLCKFKNMMGSKLQGLKLGKPSGCAGRQGGHPNKMPGHIKGPHFGMHDSPEGGRPEHHHGRPPHHMRPHGHGGHRGHHHRHHFMHALVKALVAVLIPVMAGVTVGMTVSLLGLAVGRLISFLWIKFARGGRRGYASVAQEELAAAEEGEMDKGITAAEEAPPVYEDAPAYEVVEKESK